MMDLLKSIGASFASALPMAFRAVVSAAESNPLLFVFLFTGLGLIAYQNFRKGLRHD